MLASFVAFKRSPDEILLVCSQDLLPGALKRLSMFVLRSKAKLSDASAEVALYGLAGDAVPSPASARPGRWGNAQEPRRAPVPADGGQRAVGRRRGNGSGGSTAMDPALWQWGEVRSGIATLTTPVAEAFVPQMLNYESVGGVNFKKGCYPGQEVVARSQFRQHAQAPRLRRACRCGARDRTGGVPGVRSGAAGRRGGRGRARPGGGWDAIVSLQLTAAEAGDLHAGTAGGPA